jgi:uncharacterized membrane protein YhhN
MQNNKSIWLLAFAAASFIHILGQVIDQPILLTVTKPLLMPLLAAWFYYQTIGHRPFLRKAILSGLGFATAGDILLMFTHNKIGELFFLGGLVGFLVTHLFYIGGFFSHTRFRAGFVGRNPAWVLVFLVYLAGFLWWLWPGLDGLMHWPVAIYAGVIMVMSLSVLNLRGHVPGGYFWWMMAGAILFVLSDSLLAVSKFHAPFPGDRLLIMVTYIFGQWMLVSGTADVIRSRGKGE